MPGDRCSPVRGTRAGDPHATHWSEIVQRNEIDVRIIQDPTRCGLACRSILGNRTGRRRSGPTRHAGYGGFVKLCGLSFKSKQHWADRDFIADLQTDLLYDSAVHTYPVSATQVPEDDPVVSHRDATMAPRDPGVFKPGVAIGVPADKDDGTLESDGGCRPLVQGDELE
jgi:hypothetical protein